MGTKKKAAGKKNTKAKEVPEVVGDEVVDQAAEDLGKKKKPASKKGGANKKGKSDDIDEDNAASDDVVEKKSKTVAKPAAKKKGKMVDVEADGVAQDEEEVIPAVLEKKPKKAST